MPQPGDPQSLNRYAYVRNNPLRYNDPTGHRLSQCGYDGEECGGETPSSPPSWWEEELQEAQTTISFTYQALAGQPFGSYRDTRLSSLLTHQTQSGPPDLTIWLVDTMRAHASGPATGLSNANKRDIRWKYAAHLAWFALVKPRGPWDFKVEFNSAEVRVVKLGEHTFDMDAVANLHYGYVGAAAGFPQKELLMAAGGAQIYKGTAKWAYWRTYFDDPRDQRAIRLGYWLYKTYKNALTVETFTGAVNEFYEDETFP